jgi:hypothetical protein
MVPRFSSTSSLLADGATGSSKLAAKTNSRSGRASVLVTTGQPQFGQKPRSTFEPRADVTNFTAQPRILRKKHKERREGRAGHLLAVTAMAIDHAHWFGCDLVANVFACAPTFYGQHHLRPPSLINMVTVKKETFANHSASRNGF